MSPSLERTDICSLSSFVWIENFTTLASGLTMLIPDFSVFSETIPKKSITPTCPAGMTVKSWENAPSRATPATNADRFIAAL
ncbi:hypothetical protein D3C83_120700 [compost metagenome]